MEPCDTAPVDGSTTSVLRRACPPASVPADDEHSAVRQQGSGVVGPSFVQPTDHAKGPRTRVEDLQTVGWRGTLAGVAAGHEDLAVREESCPCG